MRKSREFFVCQQGFPVPNANPHLYSALMLQPRVIGVVVVLGAILQSPWLFLLLSTTLTWAAIVPKHNVFDAIYNYAVAGPRAWPRLDAAPAPRRFAQAAAATLALGIAAALLTGLTIVALSLEAVFVVAVTSAVVRRFCLPAHFYYVMRRKLAAMAGLPPESASQGC